MTSRLLLAYSASGGGDAEAVIAAQKGAVNGIAPLNALSKIDLAFLPSISVFEEAEVADEAARLAIPLDADSPLLVVQADNGSLWYLPANTDPSIPDNWTQLGTSPVLSVDGRTGAVDLSDRYAPLDGDTDLLDEAFLPAEALRTDTAQTLFPSLTGERAGTTAVITSTAGEVDVDFQEADTLSLTLTENITGINVLNAPAAGTRGGVRLMVHQAAAGGPFTVAGSEMAAMADVWRNPEGAPSAMLTTASATLIVDLEVVEGVVYGEWSAPDRRVVTIQASDPNGSAITTGDGKAWWTVPALLNGYRVTAVQADVTTVSSSGTPTFQVHNVTDAVDILSTAATVDVSEFTSATAATPPVVNAANAVLATGDRVRVDFDVAGTGTKGVHIHLTLTAPPA